jgi:hypothetical protein
MPLKGHSCRSDDVDDRSAVPRTADIGGRDWHVADVPGTDSCTPAKQQSTCTGRNDLLDHLVGAEQEPGRHIEAELVPVPYFYVVYTLPAAIRDIAYQNKAMIYDPHESQRMAPTHQCAASARPARTP